MSEFVLFLREYGAFEFASAASTVVLAIFAAVQLQHLRTQRRNEERTAYGALWVEYWRMWTVSENWKRSDLIALSRQGLFDPDQILPRDWGAILPLLGRLGSQTARFGGSAYATASNAALLGRNLSSLLEQRTEELRGVESAVRRSEIMADYKQPLDQTSSEARRRAREAADSFSDALRSAPKWLQAEEMNLDGLSSPLAERMRQRIADRPKPLLGSLGRHIANPLRHLVARLDPPLVTPTSGENDAAT